MKYECIQRSHSAGGNGGRMGRVKRAIPDEEYFARLRERSQYTVDRIRDGVHHVPTTMHHSWK